MNNEVKIFENEEFGSIRTVCIDGEPWLVGKDVALILKYSNPQKAIRDHVDAEDKTVNDSFTVNGTMATLINESGFYSLVLTSKLPSAKKFKRWVTSVVLPSIRKNGAYIAEEKLRACNVLLEDKISSLAPKAEYYDVIMNNRKLIRVSDIAYEYGASAASFNQLLFRLGIQFKANDTWFLTEEYEGKGYVRTDIRRTYDYRRGFYREYVHTRWTQKGVEFLYRTLASVGITPIRSETDFNLIQIR
ncbi:phage antirepressor KilAC domain-containing protein [Ruminococcus sp.]|uniref:phage antirepressor n=1 Tax=Ruminococcus sp. TaxID=41978 RepID=UPI0025E79334|nr:phage antirepressor KilAC domain-containing protein [Ruminococcus sp.]